MKFTNQPITKDPFVERLTQIVLENLHNEQFSVSELAQQAGMSRSHLHRKLSQVNGQSVSQFIREIRLTEAFKLLKEENITAAEVAYKVGFNNPSYFNKCFHNYYGFTPGEVKFIEFGFVDSTKITRESKNRAVLNRRKRALYLLVLLLVVLSSFIIYYIIEDNEPEMEKSIAVLPFVNLSPDVENQYFADGLVEDLLNRLSLIEDLKVISRTSSELFRDKHNKSVSEIATLLGVNYILEGTVQKASDDVKINIQLIDAKSDDHLFAEQYEKKLTNVFNIQAEIAEEVTKRLSVYLSNQQLKIIQQNQTSNPKAMEYYQLGRFHSNKRKFEDLKKSIEYYEKAIALDSNYALAYAGLADTYHLLTYRGFYSKTEGSTIAIDFADKAIQIEPNIAEPHAVLGSVYIYFMMDWAKAEEELLKAISLNKNYSTAHQYYSELLSIYGRDDEAREHINIALELDPFSFIVRYLSAMYYYNTGQFHEGWDEVQICLELSKHPWAINLQYYLYLNLKNDSTAFEMWKEEVIKTKTQTAEELDSNYKNGGIEQVIRSYIGDEVACYTKDGYPKARYYAMLNDKEKALYYLEMLLDSNQIDPFETTYRQYRFLSSEPRFIAIRERMKLPPLPEQRSVD